MRWLLLLGVAACYSPTVHPGAPCGPGGACPSLLVCSAASTCEAPGASGDAAADSPAVSDAPGLDACTTCTAPANDLPGDAIDVTAGGDFSADLTYAHDDAAKGNGTVCGLDGGLDVFYKVHLTANEVFYIDTFGSDFDTVVRVFHGACAGGTPPGATVCHNNAQCGSTTATQWVGSLTAGDSCIVVDGYDATQTGRSLKVHVERGHRDGIGISTVRTPSGSYSFTNDTSSSTNIQDGTCGMHGDPDIGYYWIQCPGQALAVTATTCNAATAATAWDTVVYAEGPTGQLACKDDDNAACTYGGGFSTVNFNTDGAHLYWVVVDGGGGASGAYQLDFTFP